MHMRQEDIELAFKTCGIYIVMWLIGIGIAWLIAPKIAGARLIPASISTGVRNIAIAHSAAYGSFMWLRNYYRRTLDDKREENANKT